MFFFPCFLFALICLSFLFNIFSPHFFTFFLAFHQFYTLVFVFSHHLIDYFSAFILVSLPFQLFSACTFLLYIYFQFSFLYSCFSIPFHGFFTSLFLPSVNDFSSLLSLSMHTRVFQESFWVALLLVTFSLSRFFISLHCKFDSILVKDIRFSFSGVFCSIHLTISPCLHLLVVAYRIWGHL